MDDSKVMTAFERVSLESRVFDPCTAMIGEYRWLDLK